MSGREKGMPLIDRLMTKVVKKPTGCWEWQGWAIGGYGRIRVGATRKMVHRVSFEHFVGPIPNDLCVCHKCDNPICINPDHLFLGTRTENNSDKTAKGRQSRGEKHGMAVLANRRHKFGSAIAIQVREAYSRIGNQYLVAEQFGMSQANVSLIINQKRWQQ